MSILTIAIIYCVIGGIFLHFWGEKGITGLNLFCLLGWPLIIIIYLIAFCAFLTTKHYDDNDGYIDNEF